MSAIKTDQNGFTIVELVMAMGIGIVFVIAVTNLTINTNHIANRARDVAVANSFAENKIESLRSAGYLTLALGTTNVSAELPSELKSPRSASIVTTTASTSVKKVALSITYNEVGKPRTYSYSTYIGELGVGQY